MIPDPDEASDRLLSTSLVMSRLLLLLLLLPLAACQTARRAADATAEGVEDAADAIAGVASSAYDAARDALGGPRVPDDARVAVARIMAPTDTTTGVTGTVSFVELEDGVYVTYDLRGLSPGEHGFHVHSGNSCGAADADNDGRSEAGGAARGHLNPMNHRHGPQTASMAGRHAGDLGNVRAGSDGRARGSIEDPILTFDGPGGVVGRAMMVHGGRDDLTSQPSGAAGARVGCGVVRVAAR